MSTVPWSHDRISAAINRGPHKSSDEHVDFLEGELVEFVNRGQWVVLPASTLLHDPELAKHLQVSPMGVVPQRARRPRVIVDYSFSLVNAETSKLAHPEAMQFGKALERIITQIVEADPAYGPVQLIKIDIADGFYRIALNIDDIPKLAVAIPQIVGAEPLLALPLVLPMGWTESPPYFCAATETITDLTNQRLKTPWTPPAHRLEPQAETPPLPEPVVPCNQVPTSAEQPRRRPHRSHKRRSLATTDVFVDDVVAMGQGNTPTLRHIRRVLLHTLDEVFRPLEAGDNPFRNEPTSVKKLLKGDGYWETRKLILGWILDTLRMTVELPAHRAERLQEILDSIPHNQKRTSVKKWHKVLGELRSMSLAIPGSRGLFSLLQEALRHQANKRIRLTRGVHDCLDDFRWLLKNLSSRPTRLFELVPQSEPELLGAGDACGKGMGGVWFPISKNIDFRERVSDGGEPHGADSTPLLAGAPLVWRAEFPVAVMSKLVTTENPHGTITNSDLELAASILQKDIAAHHYDVRERTIASGSDNIAAVSWQRRGSTTTTSAPAYLLRLQAMHQRHHRYHTTDFYIPGPANAMADDASRLLSLSITNLLAHFDSTYPQKVPWQYAHPRPEILSSVISALLSKRPALELFCHEPPPTMPNGSSGKPSVSPCVLTPGSLKWGTLSTSFKSLPTAIARARLRPAVDASDLGLWKAPYGRWDRSSKAWGPTTPAPTPSVTSTFVSKGSFAATPNVTTRRAESNRYRSKPYRTHSTSLMPMATSKASLSLI
jgi:hypothetical protein